MIRSMTAFAHRTVQQPWGILVWEVRSVNHRYLELSLRLPENLRELETELRERSRATLTRGKVECQLKYQPLASAGAPLRINAELITQLNTAAKQVATIFNAVTPPSTMELLAWPGALQLGDTDTQVVHEAVFQLFELVLKDLLVARQQEGKSLQVFLQERLASMQQIVTRVRKHLPEILAHQRQKLITRFEEAKLALDANRLEQEMVLVAQKIDVTEELERLEVHLREVARNLEEGGGVGRRLDFLMQELNREANTLAAKAGDAESSLAAVELKVYIEQMREQVQNIE